MALPAAARADDTSAPARAPSPDAAPEPTRPAPQAENALGPASADALLDAARGGSDNTDIDTRLTGSVSGNSATYVTTGANVIASGSFANMAGIPIVIQNTGANVLIQNATVVNLRMN